MTRFYRPDRIDYDIVVTDAGRGLGQWTTAGVEVVNPPQALIDGGGSFTGEALRAFATSIAPRLRDFAEQLSGQDQADPSAHRYASYQSVRAIVRDAQGLLLAEVRCDGSVTIPGELDQDLRRQFIGMINGWLPMTIREVDRSGWWTRCCARWSAWPPAAWTRCRGTRSPPPCRPLRSHWTPGIGPRTIW